MEPLDLLANIGLAFTVATLFAFIAKALKQPLLLAYLLAGVVIGPELGFAWVRDREAIELISEIGLILLLFIIGLEIDLKKLLGAGRPIVVAGITQFLFCAALGFGFAWLLGMAIGGGSFDAIYLAVTLAFSSTLIVVKLLYDKFEITTLPGRITLGVLVFQDVWAILFLALQPNLHDPRLAIFLSSLVTGVGLVFIALGVSRYVLPHLFAFVAKIPELLLTTALAWCFLVSGAAALLGLSRETGALIAGVSMSTFPYNVDVIAKVINIRDFFVTLFFVALGMKIPAPSAAILGQALAMSAFLMASRFLTVFPVLYAMGNGLRASLIPSINLCNMSEFSLVIAALGLGLKHIGADLVAALTFVFAITSVLSTYLVTYNHEIQGWLSAGLGKLGFKEFGPPEDKAEKVEDDNRIVFLGFFREASSILQELELLAKDPRAKAVLRQILVIDFNPVTLEELGARGVRCVYGDISNMDTLHHANIEGARVVVSTLSDSILRGTTSLRILQQTRRLCPHAQVLVASDTVDGALDLYAEGADFVYIARLHSARHVSELIAHALQYGLQRIREEAIRSLKKRREVLP
ncbi:MAG TPA: cation:proton antiporter [Verrucomicrobiae bacterium]|jgi:Kef-type K+ transport system membrane component KefB|nr:cation:proton antiporter [Verrucomicrobiae bacterium]